MRQQTFSQQGSFEKYFRKSRREIFLDEADRIVPWSRVVRLVEPHYPKGKRVGRR